ncbi:MAG: serine/threonine protein kinase [Acidobacteria bacterium]|nr:serine/threonine protein kinase [Acidobacteriota bacterium]
MKTNFGKYRVEKELGKGAMGVVYLAFDPTLERQVAIKTISSTESDADLKERFIREARSAGKLRHNNIITIYDFGEEDGQLFIAMELLEGKDLDAIIASKPDMALKEKLDIIRQICLGLDYAHKHDVFHRDIKPANIKVLADGTIKIMDFGLATMQTSGLTKTGTIMGTPHYMSPEMVSGKKVDGRSDQFAVGVILYEILTYTKPFSGDNISTILYKILSEEPKSFSDISTSRFPELVSICEKALQKKAENRYPTMKAMADDIERLIQKVTTQGFHVQEPTMIVDDKMETIIVDTEIDYGKQEEEKKKETKRGKKNFPILAGSVFAVLAIVFILWVAVFNKTDTTGGIIAGNLIFNVKPYAVIDEIVNTDNSQIITLDESVKVSPAQIPLNPGNYRVTYSHPQWNEQRRSREIRIVSGKAVSINDYVSPNFAEDAINHFKVYK